MGQRRIAGAGVPARSAERYVQSAHRGSDSPPEGADEKLAPPLVVCVVGVPLISVSGQLAQCSGRRLADDIMVALARAEMAIELPR